MPSAKPRTSAPRRSTPAPPSWPVATAAIVRHLRPYLGVSLLVLVVVLASALAVVLVRAAHVTIGPVQVTRLP